MLKIFTTQLSGIFSRIGDKQAEAIEDGARLLAQAVVSGHAVYFHGKNELAAVALEASESKEPFPGAKVLPLDQKERSILHPSDRVLLFIQIQKIKRFNPLSKSCTNKAHLLSVSALHKRRHHLLKSIVMSTLIFSSKNHLCLLKMEQGSAILH